MTVFKGIDASSGLLEISRNDGRRFVDVSPMANTRYRSKVEGEVDVSPLGIATVRRVGSWQSLFNTWQPSRTPITQWFAIGLD